MKLVAIMPVRNEAWVLGLTARAALLWVDELIVLDHASTDGIRVLIDLARVYPNRVTWMMEEDPEWREMAHRQRLLEAARARKATHIVIVDADEILSGNLLPTIRNHVANVGNGGILQLPMVYLRGGIHRYHANGIWGNRIVSVAFKDAEHAAWTGDQLHHREPFYFPNYPHRPEVQGGVMHLWGADERRLIAKHALYKMTERLRWPAKPVPEIERLYNFAICGAASAGTRFDTRWEYAPVPDAWWEPYRDLLGHLDLSAIPWQEAECQRLWSKYGPGMFEGLDLFGVAGSMPLRAAV